MTQKVIFPLNGAMNADVAPQYLKSEQGEVTERRNCRVVSVAGNKTGINTSIKGTTQLVSYPNHIALNSIEDVKRDRLLLFLKDETANIDKIVSVVRPIGNSTAHTISTLFESTAFNFNKNYTISSDVLDDYLVFTDGFNPPRKLYIGSGAELLASSSLNANNIQLAVRPPSQAPTVYIGSDSTKKINKILDKTFQFAYMYVYADNSYSTLSPYSELGVSPSIYSEFNTQSTGDNSYTDNSFGNYINVGLDLGTAEVAKVKILAREGNSGSWFVIDEVVNSGIDDYTPYSFSFYNDRVRQYLTTQEALALYSDVPQLAGSILTVKNRVGLADITKGYDKTEVLWSQTVELSETNISSSVVDMVNAIGEDGTNFYVEWTFPTLALNDTVSVNFNGSYSVERGLSSVGFSFEYAYSTVVSDDDVTGGLPDSVINRFIADITSKSGTFVDNQGNSVFVSPELSSPTTLRMVFLDVKNVGETSHYDLYIDSFNVSKYSEGVSTHKAGSYRNVGIVFYDEYSRTSGVLSPQRVYIPSNGERDYADKNKMADIAFTIADLNAPSWAKYYRFAISESINYSGVYPFIIPTTASLKAFEGIYIDDKKVIAINLPLNLGYEFINGDFVLLEVDSGTAIKTIVKSILGLRSSITVSSTVYAGNWLIIPASTDTIVGLTDIVGSIYRPKDEVSTIVYYETEPTYNVASPTLTGMIGGKDAWFVQRKFQYDSATAAAPAVVVEDFTLNVDSGIRAYNKGRAIVELEQGKMRLQHFVWSKQYLDNTKINRLSFFESLSRIELDEKNGIITDIKLVGDIIKVIQPIKETSLYVGKQQITNADGALSLVSTANFIGTVYPLTKTTGSTYKKSIVTNDGAMYYWDGKRGCVVRSGGNEPFELSSKGMNSVFTQLKKDLQGAYWSDVVFHFDNRYNELICTFNWRRTNNGTFYSTTIVFSEEVGGWVYYYDLKSTVDATNKGADVYGRIGEANYGFCYGKLYELDSNSSDSTLFSSLEPLKIESYINVAPVSEKVLKSVSIDSNKGLNVAFDSDKANTRTLGNYTYLVPASFRVRDGLYASSVYRNIRTSLGVNASLLYDGNLFAFKTSKVTLTGVTGDATETELRFMHIGFVPSN